MRAADAVAKIAELDGIARGLLNKAASLEGPDAVRVSVAVLREIRETLSMRIEIRDGSEEQSTPAEDAAFAALVDEQVERVIEQRIERGELVPRDAWRGATKE